MKRAVLIFSFVVGLALPALAVAGGGTFQIAFEDNEFVPSMSGELTATNSTFEWERQPGSTNRHNIRQDDKLFRSGDPSSSFDSYSRLPSAGTFHYYCERHGGPNSGMQGTLELTPVYTGGSFPDGSFKLAWASAATNTGGAFDVRFRVNHGDWRVWKNDTSKFRGRFGKNGNPVTVKPGKDYGFKARSQKSSNPSKHSDWSPAYGD